VEGGVWVALYGGGTVRRYTPDGVLDEVIEVASQ
jgi:sugar lactone lactonase YvrE